MTITEFNNTGWGGNMKCEYEGETFDIASVDFKEALIGFSYTNDESLHWARCENVELLKNIRLVK